MHVVMWFPPFDLLHWFVDNHSAKYNISLSDMLPATLSEVGLKIAELNLAENFPHGSPELRELLAEQHSASPDRVLVTASCSEANLDVCAALLKPGDDAIVVMPNYPPLRDLPKGVGANVREFYLKPEEDFKLDVEGLEKMVTKKTRLIILTNINNPTSSMVDEDQLSRLADLAKRKDLHVMCDETFRELAFEKKPPTAAILGDRMIVTNTMSKVYGMGGLKLGWVVAGGTALERILNFTEYNTVSSSGLSDRIALFVLRDKKKYIERARNIITKNRPVVEEWFERNEKVHWDDPGVGNMAFPQLEVDVDRLAKVLLEKHETIIAPGSYFGVKDRFRLGFGRKTEDLVTGLENLDRALKSMG